MPTLPAPSAYQIVERWVDSDPVVARFFRADARDIEAALERLRGALAAAPAPAIESLPSDDQHDEALGRLRDIASWLRARAEREWSPGRIRDTADHVDESADWVDRLGPAPGAADRGGRS